MTDAKETRRGVCARSVFIGRFWYGSVLIDGNIPGCHVTSSKVTLLYFRVLFLSVDDITAVLCLVDVSKESYDWSGRGKEAAVCRVHEGSVEFYRRRNRARDGAWLTMNGCCYL